MKIIGYLTTFIVTAVFGTLWSGYVLSVLWEWFLVKPFGAPALSIATAIGLSLIVSYMTAQRLPETSVEKEKSLALKMTETCLYVFFKPAFALAFGAIIKHWVIQ